MRLRQFMRRFIRDERGNTILEFAIILPVFVTILMVIIEMATFFWTRNTLQFAAEEGVRTALVDHTASTSAVKTAVEAKLSGATMDPSRLSVTTAQDTYSGVTFMKVTVTYTWPSSGVTGMLPVDLGSATGEARVPMVQ